MLIVWKIQVSTFLFVVVDFGNVFVKRRIFEITSKYLSFLANNDLFWLLINFYKNREAKFKSALRVDFFLDFFLQVPQRELKKYSLVINISIENYKFLCWHEKKNRNQIFDISVENRQKKFNFLKFCVC